MAQEIEDDAYAPGCHCHNIYNKVLPHTCASINAKIGKKIVHMHNTYI